MPADYQNLTGNEDEEGVEVTKAMTNCIRAPLSWKEGNRLIPKAEQFPPEGQRSFASSEISALSRREIGQPALAP